MKDLIFTYAKQPSTWRGISIIAGALGVYVNPEAINLIGAGVASFIGAVEVVRNEKKAN